MLDLVELFCRIDDFWKNFELLWNSHLLTQGKILPKRHSSLSMSEIIMILILFHLIRYRDFKTFYIHYVCVYLKKEFPHLVSYTQFLELKKRAIFPLYCFLLTLCGKCSGVSFVDSTSLAVCHQKRIQSHRVFKGLAKRGKTTKGWFYGFKLHIVVNENGELLSFLLTPGNVSDLVVLPDLTKGLFGKLFGDKGYISQEMFEKLFSKGIKLITKLRAKMRNKFMHVIDKVLLKKRGLIECIVGQLKYICQIEHSRHRSPLNFVVNLFAGLISYLLRPNKPSIHIEKSLIKFLDKKAF